MNKLTVCYDFIFECNEKNTKYLRMRMELNRLSELEILKIIEDDVSNIHLLLISISYR